MGAVIGELTGANRQAARAAEGAARAKETQAQAGLTEARQTQEQLLAEANDPAALARLESQLDQQERQVARQEQLIEATDPALKEAARQALGLLQGREASSLAPVRQQRERQRNVLLNTLREQLGPGAETSTAGIQALTQFDAETGSLLAGQQQSTLSGLLGLTAQVRPDVGGEIGRLSNLTGAKFNRIGGALTRGGNLIQSAFAPTISSAGSQFVGQGVRARQMQSIGDDIFKGGLAIATGGKSLFGESIGGGEGTGGSNLVGTMGGTNEGPVRL